MVRIVAAVVALVVVVAVLIAMVRRKGRVQERILWTQVRFQLDPPYGDRDWVERRVIHRDRGGLIGIGLGALLGVGVAWLTNPSGLTPLFAVYVLALCGWWVGQVVAEAIRAAAGVTGRYAAADFLPLFARRLLIVMRLAPVVSFALGLLFHHALAGLIVALTQATGSALLEMARHRSLGGREFGLTERGVMWARALHADAVRMQYIAEIYVLGLGTALLAFYLYEFQVHARRPTALALGIAVAASALTTLAGILARSIPGWARQHALDDDPVGL